MDKLLNSGRPSRVRKKSVLVFIAEVLMELREDLETPTFPFVFLWVDEGKAIDVYVERDDGTYRYHITSTVEFVKDMNDDEGPSVEEYNLTGAQIIEQRTRRVRVIQPGEMVGGGCLDLCSYLDDEFNPRTSVTRGLKRLVEDRNR